MSGVIENIYILRMCRRLLFIKGTSGEILKVGQIFRRCNLVRLFVLLGTEYTALPQKLYAHPALEDHTEYGVLRISSRCSSSASAKSKPSRGPQPTRDTKDPSLLIPARQKKIVASAPPFV